ncbi:hypothetical protein, unlikely [Trypanosoma congolense IL3000]|uniref:Uncharacterized protein n=1 Tax=Trypanosoma congolense (strain IL3000) TaxID=1068625 RepID=F9W8V1_TRYCI|nr:hypothetical protein, unlikely [Trypanosoma congolense IL3000]
MRKQLHLGPPIGQTDLMKFSSFSRMASYTSLQNIIFTSLLGQTETTFTKQVFIPFSFTLRAFSSKSSSWLFFFCHQREYSRGCKEAREKTRMYERVNTKGKRILDFI